MFKSQVDLSVTFCIFCAKFIEILVEALLRDKQLLCIDKNLKINCEYLFDRVNNPVKG